MNVDFKKELHDKNINFLIGSGASHGALPTLETEIKKDGKKLSFEDIVCSIEDENKPELSQLMFLENYYKKIILPSCGIDITSATAKPVHDNYKELIKYIVSLISLKKINDNKRCNIFSTNYDSFVEDAADVLIQDKQNFILNDGCSGFKKRTLSASNFNIQVNNIGIFDSFKSEIPIINLIKFHGSIYWQKNEEIIINDYNNTTHIEQANIDLSKQYLTGLKTFDEIKAIELETEDKEKLKDFWDKYVRIPIVNPTKWKFNETVFEQHYYQMLRQLSYELEKKNVYLIVFGFSFKDEHIYDLIKRSLLNPQLCVYIFCYNKDDLEDMKTKFAEYKNIFIVFKHKKNRESVIEKLDFKIFLEILKGKQKEETWTVEQQ